MLYFDSEKKKKSLEASIKKIIRCTSLKLYQKIPFKLK